MKELVQYQLEIAICMIALTLLYLLLWRKETNFTFKRILLLSIPLISIILPLINLNISFQTKEESNAIQYITYIPSQLELVYAPIVAEVETISVWEIAFWIFIAGASFMFLRLLLSYFRIWQLYGQSVPDKSEQFRLIEDPFQSFSFFNMVMINRSQAMSRERDYIISHEKAHSRQGHSFDVIWLELIKMLHWFNPFIWLVTRESRQNLEYLADQEVAGKLSNIQNYQYAILQHATHTRHQLLKTQFSKSNLKNRIIMMNQPNNQKIVAWKVLIILTVLTTLFMSFSLNIEPLDIPNKVKKTISQIESSLPGSEEFESINKTIKPDSNQEKSIAQTTSTEKQMHSGGPIETNTSDPTENFNPKIQTKRDSGKHLNGNTFRLQRLDADLWEQNAYNTALVSGKAKVIAPQPYRISSGIKLTRALEYPVENQISGTITDELGEPIPGANILIKGFTIGTVTDLNGKFLLKFKPEHKEIVVSRVGYKIKTLDIISGKDYDITLVRDSEAPPSPGTYDDGPGISIQSNGKNIFDLEKKPLFILDGKEIENFDLNTINPQEIESITVFKDTSAFVIYGEKAKHGVIIIKSKNYKNDNDLFIRNDFQTKVENQIKAPIDNLPEYKEGLDAFYGSIQKTVKYPLEARKNNIQGKVFITFYVTKEGKLEDIEASETKYTLLEEIVVVGYPAQGDNENPDNVSLSILEDEVIRVLKEIDKITPLTKDGEPIDVRMTLPVTFKLD